ncbi:unnamed protein product [Larinioides sclopetarius]|uniref:Uncharacterized protein n=1 Tax=Larinioides sclopetarius TaxID=280406 RepID=A0AAV2AZG5_9ARAC
MVLKVFCFFVLFVNVYASNQDNHKHHHSQPYKFGYEINDHQGSQHRFEHGNGHGHVQGSYGFTDHRGIYREVHYVADHHGFRAKVKTNEPGTANQNPAHVKLQSDAHHQLHGQYHHRSHNHQEHHQIDHHRLGHQQVYHHHYHQQAHHGHHHPRNHQHVYSHRHQNELHSQQNQHEQHQSAQGYHHVKHLHGGHL